MAAKKKARRKKVTHTELVLTLKGHKATKQQLKDLESLGEKLALEFLAKVGAPETKFAVGGRTKAFSRTEHEAASFA